MMESGHAAQAEHHIDADSTSKRVTNQDLKKLENWYIGSIDQGTTSTRFLIFNGLGVPVASHQIEFRQMYPHSGFVDPPSRVSDPALVLMRAQMDGTRPA